jgi:hypothetical protein
MARVVTWGATDRLYRVECIDMNDGHPVEDYVAGNGYGDSQAVVEPERGVGLEQMREWAEQTAREMAEEYDAEYGGEDEDTTEGIRELYKAIEEGRL